MKKISSILLSTLLITLLLGLAGCGSDTGSNTDTKDTPTKEDKASNPSSEQSNDTTKPDKSQTLLIYSNSAGEGRGDWLTERAAKEGFKVEIVEIGGADLANRLLAEKNNPQADLVYGLNALEYEKLKKEDLLVKYEPTWATDVDMTLGDAEGYYYPIVVQPLVLVYNNELTDVPSDWPDLIDPKYKDKYNLFGLGGGTAKTILSSILTRYSAPNGELGISDQGWELVKQYIQNGHMQQEGEDYIGNVIDGSVPMSQLWGSGVVQNANERNYQFGIMSPEIGVPYVTEQVALINGSQKFDLALAFADWFGASDLQAEWSQKFGTIPASPKALESAPQEVKDFIAKVPTPQKMDYKLIAENIDQWIEKVELEFVQ